MLPIERLPEDVRARIINELTLEYAYDGGRVCHEWQTFLWSHTLFLTLTLGVKMEGLVHRAPLKEGPVTEWLLELCFPKVECDVANQRVAGHLPPLVTRLKTSDAHRAPLTSDTSPPENRIVSLAWHQIRGRKSLCISKLDRRADKALSLEASISYDSDCHKGGSQEKASGICIKKYIAHGNLSRLHDTTSVLCAEMPKLLCLQSPPNVEYIDLRHCGSLRRLVITSATRPTGGHLRLLHLGGCQQLKEL